MSKNRTPKGKRNLQMQRYNPQSATGLEFIPPDAIRPFIEQARREAYMEASQYFQQHYHHMFHNELMPIWNTIREIERYTEAIDHTALITSVLSEPKRSEILKLSLETLDGKLAGAFTILLGQLSPNTPDEHIKKLQYAVGQRVKGIQLALKGDGGAYLRDIASQDNGGFAAQLEALKGNIAIGRPQGSTADHTDLLLEMAAEAERDGKRTNMEQANHVLNILKELPDSERTPEKTALLNKLSEKRYEARGIYLKSTKANAKRRN